MDSVSPDLSLYHYNIADRQRSPLAEFMKPGRLITRLDDVLMGGPDDLWSDYLNSDIHGDSGRGWCMDQTIFSSKSRHMLAPRIQPVDDTIALPDVPCDPISGKIRFEVAHPDHEALTKCLHPNPILQIPSAKCPCPNSKWVCIRPLEAENVMRIRMKDSSYDGEVVLWQGDRRVVLQDVKVAREGTRFMGPFVRWGDMFMK